MRGSRIFLLAAAFAALLAGCATANDTSAAPSSTDIQSATTYLAGTNPNDGKVGEETWARGVVLRTHYKSDAWSTDWSMTVLKTDGSTVVYSDSFSAIVENLNSAISAGDYVVFEDDGDQFVNDTEVKVVQKAAVEITGN